MKLRLRHAGRDYDFIPYEEVLDTMLHELCHIARGPHDAQFYKLWDELRKVHRFFILYDCVVIETNFYDSISRCREQSNIRVVDVLLNVVLLYKTGNSELCRCCI